MHRQRKLSLQTQKHRAHNVYGAIYISICYNFNQYFTCKFVIFENFGDCDSFFNSMWKAILLHMALQQ